MDTPEVVLAPEPPPAEIALARLRVIEQYQHGGTLTRQMAADLLDHIEGLTSQAKECPRAQTELPLRAVRRARLPVGSARRHPRLPRLRGGAGAGRGRAPDPAAPGRRLRGLRLFIFRDSLDERDPDLDAARRPTCLQEELDGYVWDKGGRDRPAANQDDHAADAARYLIFALDAPREVDDGDETVTVCVA